MKARRMLSLLLVLLLVLSLTACGAESTGNGMAKDEAEYNRAPEAAADSYYAEMDGPVEETMASGLNSAESGSTAQQLPANRKLIRTIWIDAETEDLTALQEDLAQRINRLGGYVEAKEIYNGSSYSGYIRRNMSMTVRIPAEKADEFVSNVSQQSNIISSNESMDDVTLQYVDTESHVKALETEQERLLALLEKADNLKDILTLEEHLTSVRYQLERYASQLRSLENQVTYATIHLSVTEVKEYTPVVKEEPTAWERIAEGFVKSIKDIGEDMTDFFVWLLVNSPYLLIWGIVITAVLLVIRKRRVKWQKKIDLSGEKKE